MAGPRTGLPLPVSLSRTCFLGCTVWPASLPRRSIPFDGFDLVLIMPRQSTRRPFGTLVALVIILAGCVLIYSGWQGKPGREEILALGIGMTFGGLILVVWFGR